MVQAKTLMKLLYKDKFTTNKLRRLHNRRLRYYKILYFILLAVELRDKQIRLFSFDEGIRKCFNYNVRRRF